MLSSNLIHVVWTIEKDAIQKIEKAKAKMITTEASNNKHNDQGALSAQSLQTPQSNWGEPKDFNTKQLIQN